MREELKVGDMHYFKDRKGIICSIIKATNEITPVDKFIIEVHYPFRNRVLDIINNCEMFLEDLFRELNIPLKKQTFGQKIKKLEKFDKNKKISKESEFKELFSLLKESNIHYNIIKHGKLIINEQDLNNLKNSKITNLLILNNREEFNYSFKKREDILKQLHNTCLKIGSLQTKVKKGKIKLN